MKYLTYILFVAVAILEVFNLIKDWSAHKTSLRRWTVLGLIVLIGIAGGVNTYFSAEKNEKQHEDDQKKINKMSQEISSLTKESHETSSLTKEVRFILGELVRQGKITKKDAQVILSGMEAVVSGGKAEAAVHDEIIPQAKENTPDNTTSTKGIGGVGMKAAPGQLTVGTGGGRK